MSVSVIIPTYNGADFIAETLESVLGQSLRPGEILVIDDGSTDNTVEIAESFGPPVRVIVRANARQASNRNFGVQEARGEWIAFIDQDDLWKSNKIARQMEELQRTPQADICYTARQEFRVENGVKHMGYIVPVPPAERIREALFRNTTFMPVPWLSVVQHFWNRAASTHALTMWRIGISGYVCTTGKSSLLAAPNLCFFFAFIQIAHRTRRSLHCVC